MGTIYRSPDALTDIEKIKKALERDCELRPSEVDLLLAYIKMLEEKNGGE